MDPEIRIVSGGPDDLSFRKRIAGEWDVGLVADVITIDGTEIPAVLIGVSADHLILELWSVQNRVPSGEPFTLDLSLVAEIRIP